MPTGGWAGGWGRAGGSQGWGSALAEAEWRELRVSQFFSRGERQLRDRGAGGWTGAGARTGAGAPQSRLWHLAFTLSLWRMLRPGTRSHVPRDRMEVDADDGAENPQRYEQV